MPAPPSIETPHLRLRAFTLGDAPAVQAYCADADIASTTINIPHPYEDGMAEEWITTHAAAFREGRQVTFAIERRADDALVGAIDLRLAPEHRCAELGYVIYKPFWGQGYATEAAIAIIRYGFDRLDLNRIEAHYLDHNPASGRVMEKAGMTFEGTMRQHIIKDGVLRDTHHHAILRADPVPGYDTSTTPEG
jgi:ribosomal-protein-alanine N-acetyltransferase